MLDGATAIRHFQAHNRVQIETFLKASSTGQQLVIQLLPLLIHLNHPALPGFSDEACPIGIVDYQPDNQTLQAAQQTQPGFNFRRQAQRRYAFQGLYCLTTESLFIAEHSTALTFWLIYQKEVSDAAATLIADKLQRITEWAKSKGVTLHFEFTSAATLIDHAQINSQLENFYLNGVVLAGAVPAWWLTAENTSPDESLEQSRLLNSPSVLDFGSPPALSAEVLFEAAYARWLAALSARPADIIQHYFLQQQLQRYPHPIALSALRKSRILAAETNIFALDRLSLMVGELADSAAYQRVQVAFYQLSQEALSKNVKQAVLPLRRQFMQHCVNNWQWPALMLQQLDQPETHHYRQQIQQQTEHFQQLQGSLQQLQAFAQRHSLRAQSQLTYAKRLLGFKQQPAEDNIVELADAFRLNSGFEQLFLHRFAKSQTWHLNDIALSSPQQTALHRSESLIQLLAFAIHNRLLTRTTWLRVADQQQHISLKMVIEICQQLLRSPLVEKTSMPEPAIVNQHSTAQQLMLFINLSPPAPQLSPQHDLQVSSLRNDPLCYTSSQMNLVNSIDLLVLSSWGHWHHRQFTGPDAVISAVSMLLRWQPNSTAMQPLVCWCPTPIFSQAISQRLHQLFETLISHQQQPEHGRFFLRIATTNWQIDWQQGEVETVQRFDTDTTLKLLTHSTPHFIGSRLDTALADAELFNTLLAVHQQASISIFIQAHKTITRVWLIDVWGSLTQYDYPAAASLILADNLFSFFWYHVDKLTSVAFFSVAAQPPFSQPMPHVPEPLLTGLSVALDSNQARITLHYKEQQLTLDLSDAQTEQRLTLWLKHQQLLTPTLLLLDALLLPHIADPTPALLLQTKLKIELRLNRLLKSVGLVL